MKKFILSLVLFLLVNQSFSQSLFSKSHKRYGVEVYAGLNSFHGDIIGKAGFILGTKFNWHLTSAFALYTSLDFSNFNGFDPDRNNRFSNNSTKLMLGGEAYLFNILRFNGISSFVQPYLGLGIGGLKSNFKKSNISGSDLELLHNDWSFCYQFSGGLKVKISNSFDIQGKLAIFYTKTDLLDNYKPNVPANKKNDAFNEYTIGITYHFGNKNKNAIIWNSLENTVFGLNTSQINNKKNKSNMDDISEKPEETKVVSDEPILYDTSEPTYQDVDENEFDCIIKY